MARQFEKPETGRPAASGFLCSGAPCPLDPKQINRGDYCHRYAICTAKKKIDPAQTAETDTGVKGKIKTERPQIKSLTARATPCLRQSRTRTWGKAMLESELQKADPSRHSGVFSQKQAQQGRPELLLQALPG
jgi:hypothetical protein